MKLKRDDDGYWFWELPDGRESPIFCVKKLAMQWRRGFLHALRASVPKENEK